MTFLALIIALVVLQAWGSGSRVQVDGWFDSWSALVGGWNLPGALALALAVLAPAAVAGVVTDALAPVLFGLLWMAAAVLVLLYSLGRGDYQAQLDDCGRQCREGDFEGAFLATGAGDGAASTPQEVQRMAQRFLVYEGFQRWFAVVFYFMLLGPAGALAYRLLHLCRERLEPELAARCLFVADWVPARLLAAAFVLTGDFVGSRDELLDALQNPAREAGELLQQVGDAALSSPTVPEENFGEWAAQRCDELGSLLKRSAGAWLVVISLFVVFF